MTLTSAEATEQITAVIAKLNESLNASTHAEVRETLENVKSRLQSSLDQISGEMNGEQVTELRLSYLIVNNVVQLSTIEENLKQARNCLRPEFLCGIPEEEWRGCVPPSLVMTDIPFEVISCLHLTVERFD